MLKNNKIVRRLAWILCLSLIVGLIPVGMLSMPTPVNAVPDNLLINGGFENGNANWSANPRLSIVTDDQHGGNAAGQYFDDSNAVGGSFTQKAAVEPGKTYEVSAWVKRVSGKGGYIGIFGISNAVIKGFADVDGWQLYSISVTIPAGATQAIIEIGAHKSEVVTFLIDDVVLKEVSNDTPEPTETTEATEATQPTEADPNALPVNGNFENGVANWKGHTNAISAHTEDQHGGNASMLFVDDSTAAAPYVYQKVTVEPGKTYKVSAWVKRVSGKGGYIGIFGVTNPVLEGFKDVDGWQQYSTTITILEGANQATVEIGASKANIVTYLIDDVVFEEVTEVIPDETEATTEATEATESTEATEAPEDGAVANGGFETDLSDWTVRGNASTDTFNKHSGSAALKFVDSSSDAAGYIMQKITVEPGKTYTLSAYVKIAAGAGGYFGIFGLGTDVDVIQTFTQSEKWTLNSITVTVPEGVTQATIEIGAHKSQVVTFLLDDMVFGDPVVEEPEETEATEPVDPMNPLKENFEKFLQEGIEDAGPAGWTSNDDANKYLPMIGLVNNALSLDGYYLRLQKAGEWAIQSPAFPVEIGYEYTVTFMARKLADNDNFAGTAVINFVNYRGKILASQQIAAGNTYGEWAEESLAAVAPVGAVKAYVVFKLEYSDGRIKGDYAVDNLSVTRAETPEFEYEADPDDVEPTEFEKIFADSFENHFNPEGAASSVKVPVDWTVSENTASIGNAKYDSYDGTLNLVVQGPRNMWARSPLIDATPGYYYYADFVEKKLQPYSEGSGGYAKVVFVDVNGEIVKEYTESVGVNKKWAAMEVGGQAPAGAAQFYVEFGILDSVGAAAYSVDNLVILEGAAKLPASEPSNPEATDPTTPADPEDNAPTGDHVAVMSAYTVLTVVVILAVLVLKKRNFF